MEPDDKRAILAELDNGKDALLGALVGVTEDMAPRVPAPGRWSVLECVEHVAVAEDCLFSSIVASCPAASPMVNSSREAAILLRAVDCANKRESPDVARPKGRYGSLGAAVEAFLAGRMRTTQFVLDSSDDLRSMQTTHPIMGDVNCYEVLLLMAVHPRRHAAQIDEIKAALAVA